MTISLLFLLSKAIALVSFTAMNLIDNQKTGDTVITVLAFSCILLLDYLLLNFKKPATIAVIIINVATSLGIILFFKESMIVLLIFLLLEIAELLLKGSYIYQFYVVISILPLLIFQPEPLKILISVLMCSMLIISRIVYHVLESSRNNLSETRQEISTLKNKINNLNAYTKTVKEAAALEERSRFAVRIHDELGHGISGSIILLEAAKLHIDSNPEQAKQCIETATDNLRNGVDSIRKSLHQERPDVISIGIKEIETILEKHKADYDTQTHFSIEGDADNSVSYTIWSCIKDNLTETLTNMLKHSQATEFSLKISVMNKIIRVEYADNGKLKTNGFKKGMGLTAIENRTEKAGGKCLFLQREDGFHIVNIFNIE